VLRNGSALVTTRQAASLLGVAQGTIRAQILKGRLRAEKRGRDLFIRLDELDRYSRDVQPRRRGGPQPRRPAPPTAT